MREENNQKCIQTKVQKKTRWNNPIHQQSPSQNCDVWSWQKLPSYHPGSEEEKPLLPQSLEFWHHPHSILLLLSPHGEPQKVHLWVLNTHSPVVLNSLGAFWTAHSDLCLHQCLETFAEVWRCTQNHKLAEMNPGNCLINSYINTNVHNSMY